MALYSTLEPVRKTSDLLFTCPGNMSAAMVEAVPPASTPSSISGTTVTDASAVAAWRGCFAIPEDGDAKDQARFIKTVTASTSYVVDSAWESVTGVTRIRIWDPVDGVFVSTAQGNVGGTTSISSRHDDQASDWPNDDGAMLIGVGGTNAGKAVAVTDYDTSTNTLTHAALTQTEVGDVALLLSQLRPDGGTFEVSMGQTFIGQPTVGYAGHAPAVRGVYAPTISFSLGLRPSQGAGVAGTAAVRPMEIGGLLADVMLPTADSGSTVASASGATLTVAGGQGANFSVGGFALLHTGELCHIRGISTDTLTFATGHMADSAAIAASSVVNGAYWYQKRRTAIRPRDFWIWRGRTYFQYLKGCMPSLTISIKRNGVVTFGMNYTAAQGVEQRWTFPVSATASLPVRPRDISTPRDPNGARFLLDGKLTPVKDMELTIGFTPSVRGAVAGLNNAHGTFAQVGPTTVTFALECDQDDRSSFEAIVDRLNAKRTIDLLVQAGTAKTATMGIAAPYVQMTGAPIQVVEGQWEYNVTAEVLEPRLCSTSINILVPDIAIGFC